MKTKETYLKPEIELIVLDNDISLQLASDPNPQDEPNNWSYNQYRNNPMNDQLA